MERWMRTAQGHEHTPQPCAGLVAGTSGMCACNRSIGSTRPRGVRGLKRRERQRDVGPSWPIGVAKPGEAENGNRGVVGLAGPPRCDERGRPEKEHKKPLRANGVDGSAWAGA